MERLLRYKVFSSHQNYEMWRVWAQYELCSLAIEKPIYQNCCCAYSPSKKFQVLVGWVGFSVQQDSWSCSRNSRLGLSRPGIGLGLDRIYKSGLVLVLVLNTIDGLAELRCSARLLILVSKFKWLAKIRYWSWS